MTRAIVSALICATILGGCATKRYARVAPLTTVEEREMTCRELRIEEARTRALYDQVSNEASINFMSVMGFLGDFGLGNVNERGTAERTLETRMNSIEYAKARNHCDEEAKIGIPGGVALVPANTQSGYCILAPAIYTGAGSRAKPAISDAMPRCEE